MSILSKYRTTLLFIFMVGCIILGLNSLGVITGCFTIASILNDINKIYPDEEE